MPHIASAPSPRPALRSRPAPHTLLDGRGLRGRRAGRLRPAARHPAREGPLRDAAHDERAGRDVAGDGRPGADVGVVPDRDRGDELRVAPDLHARPDLRVVLREPVVVAGDRPGTDVGLRPDLAVAEVSEMVRLRPRAEHRLLGPDEVPELHALAMASP